MVSLVGGVFNTAFILLFMLFVFCSDVIFYFAYTSRIFKIKFTTIEYILYSINNIDIHPFTN